MIQLEEKKNIVGTYLLGAIDNLFHKLFSVKQMTLEALSVQVRNGCTHYYIKD